MYANPLLIVQAMYSTFKGQSVYYSFRRVISENIYFHLSRKRFSIKNTKTVDIISTFPLNREGCMVHLVPVKLCLITKARDNFLFESRIF